MNRRTASSSPVTAAVWMSLLASSGFFARIWLARSSEPCQSAASRNAARSRLFPTSENINRTFQWREPYLLYTSASHRSQNLTSSAVNELNRRAARGQVNQYEEDM